MAPATQTSTHGPAELDSTSERSDSERSDSERSDSERSDPPLSSSPVSATRESQPHCGLVDWDSYGIGALIGGKYRLEWRLGLGGMGIVWAARHVELDELVAIKCIRPDVQNDENTVQRFAREAKACARLRSEHIVRAFDVGTDEVFGPFIVLEYLDGQDLGQLLRTVGPFPVAEACGYVLQACEALAVSHSYGIVHRDLKPSNLFRISRGELTTIKLLDFGTSQASLTGNLFGGDLSLADKTTFLGTPMYMSPEQITPHQTVDHRSDVWSLGCVLHELVSGQPAFGAEDVAQVCQNVVHGEATRLTVGASDPLLEGVQRVIDRCLAKDPCDRYADVAELAQQLAPLSDAEAQVHSHRASSLLKCGVLPPPSSKPTAFVATAPSVNNPTLAEVEHTEEPFGARALESQRKVKGAGRGPVVFAVTLALALGSAAALAVAARHQLTGARGPVTSGETHASLPEAPPVTARPVISAVTSSMPAALAVGVPALDLSSTGERPGAEALRSLRKPVVKLRKTPPATAPDVSVPRLTDESKIRLLQ